MAKNMTRKGLAAASTFALAVAGLVGIATPASANTMVLEPSVGDSNRVPISEPFTLSVYHATADNVYDKNLSVQILDESESLTSFTTTAGTTGSANRDATDFTFYGEINTSGGTVYDITLTPESEADETFSVVVTTFFDSPGGNKSPDTGEIQQSYEVFFHVEDDYTWDFTFDAPAFADAKFAASVSTTPELNLAQFASEVKVGFATSDSAGDLTERDGVSTFTPAPEKFNQGTAGDTSDAEISDDGSSISFEVNVVDSESTVSPVNTVRNATYAAGLVFGTTEVARELAVVGEATVDVITAPALAASADTKNQLIREGATNVTIESDVTLSGDAVADAEVTVTVTEVSGWTEGTLVIGGEELAFDDDEALEFTTTTNSDGEVALSVDASDLNANAVFSVALSSQGVDNTGGAVNFTVTATAAADLVEHNLLGGDAEWKVEDGTYTVRFSALDNFGQPLSGDYRVVLTPVIYVSGTATDVIDEQQATGLSGGVATFTVNTTTADDDEVIRFKALLQKSSGAGYADELGGATTDLTVNLGASNPATEISVTGTVGGAFDSDGVGPDYDLSASSPVGIDLSVVEFASANERLGEAFTETLPTAEILSGSLTDASGLKTYGSVTFTGEGLLFKVPATNQSLNVYSVGSITVQTGVDGDFAGVSVYSNQAGEQTVTVSSGSASQDIVLEFDAAASTAGTSLVIDAPSSVEPGSTLVYTVSLTDDFGNPVNGGSGGSDSVELAYDGPGFIVGDALTSISDFGADGELTVTIFLGNNDDGKTGTLTVSYSPDNDGTYTDDDDLVVQKTVNIGNVPGAAGEFNAWTKLNADNTNVKFYAKNPSNQGKIQFFFNGEEIAWHRGTSNTSYEGGALRYDAGMDSYYLVRDVDLVSGIKNVFEIYQDGERIWRAVKTLD